MSSPSDCASSSSAARPSNDTRVLSQLEEEKLQSDTQLTPAFKREKLCKETAINWDRFYKRNECRFFKDRHWTRSEFTELCGENVHFESGITIFEAGCGVGNFILPFLNQFPRCFGYACDFSPRAIQLLKQRADYSSDVCQAFGCDLTIDDESLPTEMPPKSSIDLTTLIFVLSAVPRGKMENILKNIHKVLKPGGCLIVRDYGLYDHAMLRFAKGHRLEERSYWRQDGTLTYYFSKEELCSMMNLCGFQVDSCQNVHRLTTNRKEGKSVERIFIQGLFRKPISTTD